MTTDTQESDSQGEQDGDWSLRAALNGEASASYTERHWWAYPYQDVADAFTWAADKRGLDLAQRLRAMATVFEMTTRKEVVSTVPADPTFSYHHSETFGSAREAWLAFGYIVEATEDVLVLTDEEREEALGVVRAWRRDPLVEVLGEE